MIPVIPRSEDPPATVRKVCIQDHWGLQRTLASKQQVNKLIERPLFGTEEMASG